MSYLKMALQAMKVAADKGVAPEAQRGGITCPAHDLTPQVEAPQASPPERILSCADCGFHKYIGPNPAHGWEHCTFNGKWCYGLRPACSEIQRQDTDVPLDG